MVAVALAAGAPPAAAHPRLRDVNPTPQATVPGPLPLVTLRFTESPDWKLSRVDVTDTDGRSVLEGPPVLAGAEGRFPLQAGATGAMLVSWLVVGDDAHPVQGQFVFAVTGDLVRGPAGSAGQAALSSQLLSLSRGAGAFQGRAGAAGLGWLIRGGRSLEILLLYVVLGVLLLRAVVLRPSLARTPAQAGGGSSFAAEPPYRLLLAAGAGSALLMPVLFWLYADRVRGLVAGTGIGDVLSSSLGTVWEAKAALWAVFAAVCIVGLRRRDRAAGERSRDGLLLALALSVTAAFVLNTHARSATPILIFTPLMWSHVLVTAFWAGGLLALLLLVFPSRDPEAVWAAVGRFSRIMTVTAGVIVVSGIVMLAKLGGGWKSLSCTDFGVVAQFKVAIVAVALAIGAVNNRLVANRRRLATGPGARAGRRRSIDSLRRIVMAEAAVLVTVLLLSAALGETELPPLLKGRLLPGEAQESVRPGLFASGCRS